MNRDGGAKPKFLKQQFVKSLASIPKQLQIANVCQKVNNNLDYLSRLACQFQPDKFTSSDSLDSQQIQWSPAKMLVIRAIRKIEKMGIYKRDWRGGVNYPA